MPPFWDDADGSARGSGRADDGEVMAIRHRDWPIDGVQFHPESIATEHGVELIANWLRGY